MTLLRILPHLWIFYFHVRFFSELVGTFVKRVSTFHIGYLSYVAPTPLRVDPNFISVFLYDLILSLVSPIFPEVPLVHIDIPSRVAMNRLEEISLVCCLCPR